MVGFEVSTYAGFQVTTGARRSRRVRIYRNRAAACSSLRLKTSEKERNMIINWCRSLVLFAMSGALFFGTVIPQAEKHQAAKDRQMSLATPDGLKWVQIRPGNEMAVVYGDPSKAGELYAVRFRFADGFKVPPHWHPQDEHATVLQGTLLLGMGTKWEATQLTTTNGGWQLHFRAERDAPFCPGQGSDHTAGSRDRALSDYLCQPRGRSEESAAEEVRV